MVNSYNLDRVCWFKYNPESFRTFVVGTSYQLGNLISSSEHQPATALLKPFPTGPQPIYDRQRPWSARAVQKHTEERALARARPRSWAASWVRLDKQQQLQLGLKRPEDLQDAVQFGDRSPQSVMNYGATLSLQNSDIIAIKAFYMLKPGHLLGGSPVIDFKPRPLP